VVSKRVSGEFPREHRKSFTVVLIVAVNRCQIFQHQIYQMQNKIEFYQLTSAGDRSNNQDCMANYVGQDYALFIVADGLGGHYAGEKASQFFCRGMLMLLDTYQPLLKENNVEAVFAQWVNDAIAVMRQLFTDDPDAEKAHTTCAVLYLEDKQVITAHCGDSRIYRINQQQVLWRTKDHSLTQKLMDEGKITEREMGLHPEQNQLTRSINILNQHKVDIGVYAPMETGESFVLCSDGFWEYVKEAELLQLAKTRAPKEELRKQARLSVFRAAGSSDNVTVQLVRSI